MITLYSLVAYYTLGLHTINIYIDATALKGGHLFIARATLHHQPMGTVYCLHRENLRIQFCTSLFIFCSAATHL